MSSNLIMVSIAESVDRGLLMRLRRKRPKRQNPFCRIGRFGRTVQGDGWWVVGGLCTARDGSIVVGNKRPFARVQTGDTVGGRRRSIGKARSTSPLRSTVRV